MNSGASSMIPGLLSAPLCLHIWLSSRFPCWPEIWIVPVVHPLLCGLQRRLEVLAFALLMPVGTDDLLAAIVGLEGAMGDHAFEAVFLYLRALAVELWPLAHLDSGLELWRAPVH